MSTNLPPVILHAPSARCNKSCCAARCLVMGFPAEYFAARRSACCGLAAESLDAPQHPPIHQGPLQEGHQCISHPILRQIGELTGHSAHVVAHLPRAALRVMLAVAVVSIMFVTRNPCSPSLSRFTSSTVRGCAVACVCMSWHPSHSPSALRATSRPAVCHSYP